MSGIAATSLVSLLLIPLVPSAQALFNPSEAAEYTFDVTEIGLETSRQISDVLVLNVTGDVVFDGALAAIAIVSYTSGPYGGVGAAYDSMIDCLFASPGEIGACAVSASGTHAPMLAGLTLSYVDAAAGEAVGHAEASQVSIETAIPQVGAHATEGANAAIVRTNEYLSSP